MLRFIFCAFECAPVPLWRAVNRSKANERKSPLKRPSESKPQSRFDAFKLAERGGSLSGEVDVATLPRLQDRIAHDPASGASRVRWSVSGGRDAKGRPELQLDLDGSVFVSCQRCLHPLAFVIDQRTQVLVARDEGELVSFDAEEPEVVLAKSQLDALTLVEDELLLSLPFAPRHPEGVCDAALTAAAVQVRESPFAQISATKAPRRSSK